jgi:pilus assembly protein TadC
MMEFVGLIFLASALATSRIWGHVRIRIENHLPAAQIRKRQERLSRAGRSPQLWKAFVRRELGYAALGLAGGILWILLGLPWYLLPVSAVLGLLWPGMRLNAQIRRRQREILFTLPYYLDLLTLALECGMDLVAAVDEIVATDSPNALREELTLTLSSIRLGVGRSRAFSDLAQRTGMPPLTLIASAVAQSEELGAGLGSLLRLQAEGIRGHIFRQAEEHAAKAPLKMLFPLILLIFPVAFVLLFAPIVLQLTSR